MAKPRILHDEYFKKAKAEGYVARSAYKLLEIQDRHGVLRRGDRVLDLGCAPGSWMQVAEKLVGLSGLVIGIDLQEVHTRYGPNVRHSVGDVFNFRGGGPEALLRLIDSPVPESPGSPESPERPAPSAPQAPRARYDVVLSDMAPNTSGHGDDHLSARLCRRVLELVPALLRPGGHCVMKILEGGDCPDVLVETRHLFRNVKPFKPKSSRDVSRELFIIAEGRK